ncbi:FixH family protein [Evansella sp. AB-P1]|uniref:FixH family protein n=1 Tax=Evansella sp. AB-P1 TaxID=3037653 RepID=UPI00241ED66D|nr:FixH family protein [Evansella sp. AB-P1]MDG5786227.1 FixH family protein [Evansella sp. AB-P1]
MKRVLLVVIYTIIGTLLVGCGQSENNNSSSGEINFDPLGVEIIAPDEVDPHTDVVLQAFVTQGEEKVNDASEVLFEIWKHGQKEESDFIEAHLTEDDGVYEITYQFPEVNIYLIQPHVTARGMHQMPVREIMVGDVPDDHPYYQEDDQDHHHNHDHDHHNDHEHGDDHHHSHELHESMAVDWRVGEEVKLHEEVKLATFVEWQDAPWTEGRLRYEVYQPGDEVHDWLEAEEETAGLYTVSHVFEELGEYHIIIHIEDDELHEHVQKKVTIVGQ